ncbi:MAG TPA: TldD/PmbA family protein, partial [Clostridiaceae bacterium]|nr:TldD/PmbA family protein [Clostridiaceae bacterium]
AEPVNISVVTGNVFKTLSEIDGVSNELELLSFVTGGCGKMEQYPLPVGFGGPYVRVNNLNVQ